MTSPSPLDLPAMPEPSFVHVYSENKMRDYARAAVLADRARRVTQPPADCVPPAAAVWFSGTGIANHDWRGGWDACRNQCMELRDKAALPLDSSIAPLAPLKEEMQKSINQDHQSVDDAEHASRASTSQTVDGSGAASTVQGRPL